MEISIHDNHLLAYSVNAEKEEIVFRTAFLDGAADERTDVIFAGVAAYHFECDNFATILFDIKETEIDVIYEDNEELFESRRSYGWPDTDSPSKEELLARVRAQNIKGFVIWSSFGMSGWIWAKSMTKVAK